jgi:hypothetical protein
MANNRRHRTPKIIKRARLEDAQSFSDGWNKPNKIHWQRDLLGSLLDWWPTTGRWRWRGRSYLGEPEALALFIKDPLAYAAEVQKPKNQRFLKTAISANKEKSMDVGTVYLKGPWAPGGKEFLSGYLNTSDKTRVGVSDRSDWRGEVVYFPMENIARIETNTGWR